MTPPARLRLDGAALVANWRLMGRLAGVPAGAAVKADGYGLGAPAVGERLAAAGCRDLYVATWAEAAALGALVREVRVAVLHGVREEDQADAARSPARPVLNTLAQVARWRPTGQPCDVMVDTGMNRLGLSPREAVGGALDGLVIDTLHSHLACADDPASPENARQRAALAEVAREVPAARVALAGSGGVFLGSDFAFDVVRPGLALYGGAPSPLAEGQLQRVVTLEAQVLQRRRLEPGERVGYGGTFVAARQTDIAVVNLGYGDGYLRAFSGVGQAMAGRAPVIGRVSMDLVTLDVTDVADSVGEGEWATIDYDLAHASAATGLSPYELLTNLGARFERRWVG